MKYILWILFVWFSMPLLSVPQGEGEIIGRVTDSEHNPVPGAVITLWSPSGETRTTTSDEQGAYAFAPLPLGRGYQVTVKCLGFADQKKEHIEVSSGGRVEVDFTLSTDVGTGMVKPHSPPPMLDGKAIGLGRTVSRMELQTLPHGREPYAILNLVPGVITDRENLAGAESATTASSIARGSEGVENNTWSLEGVDVSKSSNPGVSSGHWDFDLIEEMQVITAGGDIRSPTGGIQTNLITRGAGTRQSLGGRFYLTDSAFQEENLTEELKNQGVNPNRIQSIKDYGLNLSGPLVKDKAFYWLSFGVQDIKIEEYPNVINHDILSNYALKLAIRPLAANRFEAFFLSGQHSQEWGWSPSSPMGLHAGPPHRYRSSILKLHDEHTFGSSTVLVVNFTSQRSGYSLDYTNDPDPDHEHFQWRNMTTMEPSGSNNLFEMKEPKSSASALLTWQRDSLLGGKHELLLGAEYTWAISSILSGTGGSGTGYVGTNYNTPRLDLNQDGKDEVPGSEWMRWYNTRPNTLDYRLSHVSAFLQDGMTYGRLYARAGLRLDVYQPYWVETTYDGMPSDHPALADVAPLETLAALDRLFPAAVASAQRPSEYRWTILSPRLGLAYDLKGDGKTIAKLSLALYGDAMGSWDASWFGSGPSSGWMAFWWKDDGDRQAQLNELYWLKPLGQGHVPFRIYDDAGNLTIPNPMLSYTLSWGDFDWNDPTAVTPSTRYTDAYRSPRTTEALLAVERQLGRDLAVSLDFIYRYANGFSWDLEYWPNNPNDLSQGGRVMSSDLFEVKGTIPETIPTNKGVVSTEQAAGKPWYSVSDLYSATDYRYLAERPDYSHRYYALELNLTKRLSRRWLASGSVTLQKQAAHYGSEQAYLNPTGLWAMNDRPYAASTGSTLNKINQPIFSSWMAKLTGLYQAPWGITASALFTIRQGHIVERGFYIYDSTACNPEYLPWNSGLQPGAVWVPVEKFGESRLPPFWNLNLRLEKLIRIGENKSVTISADIFNLFNLHTVERQYAENWGVYDQHTGKFWSDPASGLATEIIDPRVFRLGLRFQI